MPYHASVRELFNNIKYWGWFNLQTGNSRRYFLLTPWHPVEDVECTIVKSVLFVCHGCRSRCWSSTARGRHLDNRQRMDADVCSDDATLILIGTSLDNVRQPIIVVVS